LGQTWIFAVARGPGYGLGGGRGARCRWRRVAEPRHQRIAARTAHAGRAVLSFNHELVLTRLVEVDAAVGGADGRDELGLSRISAAGLADVLEVARRRAVADAQHAGIALPAFTRRVAAPDAHERELVAALRDG